jgi:hypothetical protein
VRDLFDALYATEPKVLPGNFNLEELASNSVAGGHESVEYVDMLAALMEVAPEHVRASLAGIDGWYKGGKPVPLQSHPQPCASATTNRAFAGSVLAALRATCWAPALPAHFGHWCLTARRLHMRVPPPPLLRPRLPPHRCTPYHVATPLMAATATARATSRNCACASPPTAAQALLT